MAKADKAPAELAARLVEALRARRELGKGAYPLLLRQLTACVDRDAGEPLILKAINTKIFRGHALAVRSKTLEAPVALLEDLEQLADANATLEFMLTELSKPTDQAFSVAVLKAKVTAKLQKSFQGAVSRRLEQDGLPETVGWITISRTKRLFLWSVLHQNRLPAGPPEPAHVEPPSFPVAFEDAFRRLDRAQGGHNFVSLAELRRAVPAARAAFDHGLRELRRAGRFGLAAAEGRHGLTAEQQEAGIVEDGTLLLYVSRKSS